MRLATSITIPRTSTEEARKPDVSTSELAPILAKVGRLERFACAERFRGLAAPEFLLIAFEVARRSCAHLSQLLELRERRIGRLASLGVAVDALKPRFLPVDQAAGLAAAVSRAIAPKILEVDGVPHSPAPGRRDRVADLLDALRDREPAAHVLKHLGHERHLVECAVFVEGRQDLARRPKFDDVARPQRLLAPRRHDALMMRAVPSGVNTTNG